MTRLITFLKRYNGYIAIAVAYIIMAILGIGCPIRTITGIPCASCGMTRAFIALLHLDLKAALYYHPLFWMVPIPLVLLVKKGPLSKPKMRVAILTVVIATFIITYIIRLLFLKNSEIYIVSRG